MEPKCSIFGGRFKLMVKLCSTSSFNQNSLFFIVSNAEKLNVNHKLIPLAKEQNNSVLFISVLVSDSSFSLAVEQRNGAMCWGGGDVVGPSFCRDVRSESRWLCAA